MRGHLLSPGGWATRSLSRIGHRKWQGPHLLLPCPVPIYLVQASVRRVSILGHGGLKHRLCV